MQFSGSECFYEHPKFFRDTPVGHPCPRTCLANSASEGLTASGGGSRIALYAEEVWHRMPTRGTHLKRRASPWDSNLTLIL